MDYGLSACGWPRNDWMIGGPNLMRRRRGELKRAFKDAASQYRNEAVQTDAMGRSASPCASRSASADQPAVPDTFLMRTVSACRTRTAGRSYTRRRPFDHYVISSAICDLDHDPLKDFVLVAPLPDVPVVLELAS